MKNVIDLAGKTILISGASSGIGAETARLCAQLGAHVVLTARREDKLREVLNDLEGEGHFCCPFDMARTEDIEGWVRETVSQAGPLDGYVHSAGIPGTRPLKMFKPKPLREVMDINFFAFVETVRCITKKNAFREGMSIVGVSSAASLKGGSGNVGYSASKAAMNAAVRCMAKELSSSGIRVNTVSPGMIETDILHRTQESTGDNADRAIHMQRQYLGIGQPLDVANLICFLLSDAAKLITGTNAVIDGGLLSC